MNAGDILILTAVGVCTALILIRKIRRCRRGQYCDCGCGGGKNCKKCRK
ncbi:MAG TPA: hypothetical protein IAB52_07455 [Candidatus Scatomonas merdavium]|nr:hypothetical protein [Candidatus Scatomonas merdavium]